MCISMTPHSAAREKPQHSTHSQPTSFVNILCRCTTSRWPRILGCAVATLCGGCWHTSTRRLIGSCAREWTALEPSLCLLRSLCRNCGNGATRFFWSGEGDRRCEQSASLRNASSWLSLQGSLCTNRLEWDMVQLLHHSIASFSTSASNPLWPPLTHCSCNRACTYAWMSARAYACATHPLGPRMAVDKQDCAALFPSQHHVLALSSRQQFSGCSEDRYSPQWSRSHHHV